MSLTIATLPDLLRLIILPVLGWAAWRDIKTRRVPSHLWPPLVALGGIFILWDAAQFILGDVEGGSIFGVRVAVSLFLVGGFAVGFQRIGGIGVADAKALLTIAILLPVFPIYAIGGVELPVVRTSLGVFSMTILSNTGIIALTIPIGFVLRNLVTGRVNPNTIFLARPVRIESLSRRHGSLFEDGDGTTRAGLDLDVLRMYLRWRGVSVAALRETETKLLRDPRSIGQTHDPTDGRSQIDDDLAWGDPTVRGDSIPDTNDSKPRAQLDDPWGVQQFFDEIDRGTYGMNPDQLRAGLELLSTTDRETVWVSIGFPFLAVIFLAVVIGFVYGDLLFGLLAWGGII